MATALLTLAEAKAHLNITVATWDSELQDFLDSAAKVIEGLVGPIDAASHTETRSGQGGYALMLAYSQVTEVTALTLVRDGSSPMTLSDLVCDPESGVVRSKAAAFPVEPFTITYTVGRTAPFAQNLVDAAKFMAEDWWESQRGSADRGDDEEGAGVPELDRRARALLEPDEISDGFA